MPRKSKGPPGTGRGRPSSKVRLPSLDADPNADLPAFDHASSAALAARLVALKHAKLVKDYAEFARIAGVSFPGVNARSSYLSRLSRWLNDPELNIDDLGRDNFNKLIIHLRAKDLAFVTEHMSVTVMDMLRSPLYHAVAMHLNCYDRNAATQSARKHLENRFRIFRPSMRQFDYGYVGTMEINYCSISNAFLTREIYVKSENERWDMQGALFPITHDVFLMLAIDTVDQTIQVKYVHGLRSEGSKSTSGFSGWIADTNQYKFYVTRFYAERLKPGETVKYDFKRIADMPSHVRTDLGRKLSSKENSFTYHD